MQRAGFSKSFELPKTSGENRPPSKIKNFHRVPPPFLSGQLAEDPPAAVADVEDDDEEEKEEEENLEAVLLACPYSSMEVARSASCRWAHVSSAVAAAAAAADEAAAAAAAACCCVFDAL